MSRKTERPAPAVLLSATPPEGADAALPAAVDTPSAPPAAVAPVAAAAAAVVAAPAEAPAAAAPAKRLKAVKPAARSLQSGQPAQAAKPAKAAKAEAAAKPGKAAKAPGEAAAPKDYKPVKLDKPAKAAAPGADAEAAKAFVKPKLVRDSFTMPRGDFALIGVLKERALGFKRPAKKSELLRAGLHALAALDDVKLQAALEDLTPLKAGRPKKG